MVTAEIWQWPLSLSVHYYPTFRHRRGNIRGQQEALLYLMMPDHCCLSVIWVSHTSWIYSCQDCESHNRWKWEAISKTTPWAWSSMRSNLPPTKLARVVQLIQEAASLAGRIAQVSRLSVSNMKAITARPTAGLQRAPPKAAGHSCSSLHPNYWGDLWSHPTPFSPLDILQRTPHQHQPHSQISSVLNQPKEKQINSKGLMSIIFKSFRRLLHLCRP